MEVRQKVEWWRYVMSWIFHAGIIPLFILIVIPMLILSCISKVYGGFAGYFCNPTQKRSFKEEWRSAWDSDMF